MCGVRSPRVRTPETMVPRGFRLDESAPRHLLYIGGITMRAWTEKHIIEIIIDEINRWLKKHPEWRWDK